jgi:ketosteroid isomerase-like protein
LKRALIAIVVVAVAIPSLAADPVRKDKMTEEILALAKQFEQAVVANDAGAVERFLAEDWVIVDPDGKLIDKARFLSVIRSGDLSKDSRVRIYEDTAVVTSRTTTKGKYKGQAFTTQERATDVFVKRNGHWSCVFSQLTRLPK